MCKEDRGAASDDKGCASMTARQAEVRDERFEKNGSKGVRTLRFAFAVALALLMAVSGLPASAEQARVFRRGERSPGRCRRIGVGGSLASTDAAGSRAGPTRPRLDRVVPERVAGRGHIQAFRTGGAGRCPAPAVQDDPAQNILVECADVAASAASLPICPMRRRLLCARRVVPEIIVEAGNHRNDRARRHTGR